MFILKKIIKKPPSQVHEMAHFPSPLPLNMLTKVQAKGRLAATMAGFNEIRMINTKKKEFS